MTTLNLTKLGKTLNDAKAHGNQQHTAAVERITAKGLICRDGDGNLVTIPED